MTNGTRRVRGQRHALVAIYPREDTVPILLEAGWAPGPVLTGVKNLAPTGFRSPNRPARSQSSKRSVGKKSLLQETTMMMMIIIIIIIS
jgi:hypothetical protein